MIRVGIADDHPVVRSGLKALLSSCEDMTVVGEASDGRETRALALDVRPDVLIMDLMMPGYSALDLMTILRERASGVAVMVYTGYPAEHYGPALLRDGARAYLGKDCDPSEVLAAVRALHAGRRYITSDMAGVLAQRSGTHSTEGAPHHSLTPREFQIFLKLAQGDSPAHIADALCVSAKTISTHKARIMAKMDLHSNSELTYYATKRRLLR